MAAFLGMWGPMTVASMVPATVPAIGLVSRAGGSGTAFAAGYVATGLVAGAAGWLVLAPLGLGAVGPGAVLAAAALYEVSPFGVASRPAFAVLLAGAAVVAWTI